MIVLTSQCRSSYFGKKPDRFAIRLFRRLKKKICFIFFFRPNVGWRRVNWELNFEASKTNVNRLICNILF